jgi:hypothetical protein
VTGNSWYDRHNNDLCPPYSIKKDIHILMTRTFRYVKLHCKGKLNSHGIGIVNQQQFYLNAKQEDYFVIRRTQCKHKGLSERKRDTE